MSIVRIAVSLMIVGMVSAGRSWGRVYYAAPESQTQSKVPGRPNDGLDPFRPFLIADFCRIAQAGDTLLLLDGRYTGPSSMIYVDTGTPANGTANQPITIRAMNDGNVLIDGEGRSFPIWIAGARGLPKRYFSIEGINACNSAYHVVSLSRCEDCVLKRVCAWGANPDSNAHVYTLDRTFRCLVEDSAAWGLGRKQLLIYGGSESQDEPYGADNIVRRFWCRWEGTRGEYHSENISFQYRATGSLLENVICTYDACESIKYPSDWTFSGFFYTDGPAEHIVNTRLLGCIGYAPRESNLLSPYVFLITGMDVLDVTLRDCLSYVAPWRTRGLTENEVSSLVTYPRYYDSVQAEHLTIVGGIGIRLGARDSRVEPAGPVVRNALIMKTVDSLQTKFGAVVGSRYVDTVYFFKNAKNFEYSLSPADVPSHILSPPGFEGSHASLSAVNESWRTAEGIDPQLDTCGRSLLRPYTSPTLRHAAPDGSDVGARLWFRYVNGVLKDGKTDGDIQYLWPWPMESRIWQATQEYYRLDPANHPPAVNVTREALTLDGGSLPGDFDADGDIDATDRTAFESYRAKSATRIADTEGYSFDFDEDGDIDSNDKRVFDTWYGYKGPDSPGQ